MRLMVVILSFVAGLGGSIVPVSATPAKTLEELLKEQVQRSGARSSLVGIAVLGNTGRALALLNADKPLKPASNMKILTTVTGLELLGVDHQYSTRIIARGELTKGKIAGNVIVRGTGDPNISGRFHDGAPLFLLSLIHI